MPAVAGNRVLYRDGVPVARLVAETFDYLAEFDAPMKTRMRMRLAQRYPGACAFALVLFIAPIGTFNFSF